jgi:hypothetical protein
MDIRPLVRSHRGHMACEPCVRTRCCASGSSGRRDSFPESAYCNPLYGSFARINLPRRRCGFAEPSHSAARHRDAGARCGCDLLISRCADWELAVGYFELGLDCRIKLVLQTRVHCALDLLQISLVAKQTLTRDRLGSGAPRRNSGSRPLPKPRLVRRKPAGHTDMLR